MFEFQSCLEALVCIRALLCSVLYKHEATEFPCLFVLTRGDGIGSRKRGIVSQFTDGKLAKVTGKSVAKLGIECKSPEPLPVALSIIIPNFCSESPVSFSASSRLYTPRSIFQRCSVHAMLFYLFPFGA